MVNEIETLKIHVLTSEGLGGAKTATEVESEVFPDLTSSNNCANVFSGEKVVVKPSHSLYPSQLNQMETKENFLEQVLQK